MTKCWKREQILAYLDNELRELEAQRFAAHARECGACRGELDRVRAGASNVRSLMGALEADEVGVTIPAWAFERRTAPARRWLGWSVAAATGALAALLLGIAGMGGLRILQPSSAPPISSTTRAPGAVPNDISFSVRPSPGGRLQGQSDILHFVALDDTDPFQAAVVVRVALPASRLQSPEAAPTNKQVQADFVIGEDGRARAFRVLQ